MSAPELFCPRCASPMQRVGVELTCVPGDMGLSRKVETELLRRFGQRAKADSPSPPPGSSWFCPACRVPLGEDMKCAECSGTLHDLLFQLIEIHPHRKPE